MLANNKSGNDFSSCKIFKLWLLPFVSFRYFAISSFKHAHKKDVISRLMSAVVLTALEIPPSYIVLCLFSFWIAAQFVPGLPSTFAPVVEVKENEVIQSIAWVSQSNKEQERL